ncbi:MAG TPA: DUF4412 domain-containing protein [Verrucomicrobia bacterium]|nr:DUF4412 domain-containing protein [Verrucomicrobiota bacterium]HOP95905.1 DUF4412 domain-containing protein [Verrucomicrobiota bacterium]
MKTPTKSILALALCLGIASTAEAQRPRGGMGGPQVNAAMAKLFGDNNAFSANLEIQASLGPGGESATIPGKIAFDAGKSRFEMSLSNAKGAFPPEAAQQMKAMGMDSIVVIGRPEKNLSYLVYPGLNAYAELPDEESNKLSEVDLKMDTTDLGKETVDGHPCDKKKVVMTEKGGKKHEFTVWNATDLKDFPVKIETSEEGQKATLVFRQVRFGKPAASSFEPPTNMKRYSNVMQMMQEEMMKRMGGGQ